MVSALERIQSKYSDVWDECFRFHLSQPQITYQEYSKGTKVELGRSVLSKVRIYLDTNYWLYCRDALRKRACRQSHIQICSLLYELAQTGIVLCPANSTILAEILKQTDPISRKQTAYVVETFSKNIVLDPMPLLARTELLHMLGTLLKGQDRMHRLAELVWGYCGHILGQCVPAHTAFDQETENALQKTFLDMFSCITFSEMVDIHSESVFDIAHYCRFDTPEYLSERNSDNDSHKKDIRSYRQAYKIELAGMIDGMGPEIQDTLEYLYCRETGNRITEEERNESDSKRLLSNFLYHAFRMEKLSAEFPQLHVFASLHAALRYKQVKVKKGDFHDHLHACSALPYCDYFFTERKLANFLCSSPLCFDEQYHCKVLSDEEAIIDALQKIRSNGKLK